MNPRSRLRCSGCGEVCRRCRVAAECHGPGPAPALDDSMRRYLAGLAPPDGWTPAEVRRRLALALDDVNEVQANAHWLSMLVWALEDRACPRCAASEAEVVALADRVF